MPSDQNLPVTPKRRARRAAATVAAGRLSSAFARQVSDDADGPPRKRRRALSARNDSSDFEGPDVEMSSPPNSKSNPVVLDSSPDRTLAIGSKSTRRKPRTAQVVVELVASKRSKASASRPVSTPAPTGTQDRPGTSVEAPSAKSARLKTPQVIVELDASKRSKASASHPVSTPAPTGTQDRPGTYKTSVSEASSTKSARLKTRRLRTIEENPEVDYINGELMLQIWKEGIDRKAHQYAQEMKKNL